MIPWETLDEVPAPDGSGTLTLVRRGDEYVIRINRVDLMSSRLSGSERTLAELACAPIQRPDPRVLVGGLGMGFTLRAALESVQEEAAIIVAELFPEVVRWNQEHLGELAAFPLNDSRVEVYEGDVCDCIRRPKSGFDAILLDVDNGPDGLTQDSNRWLYQRAGILATLDALRPGGVLGVWSAYDDPGFTKRLSAFGFNVEVARVRARKKKGRRHTIWLGTKS